MKRENNGSAIRQAYEVPRMSVRDISRSVNIFSASAQEFTGSVGSGWGGTQAQMFGDGSGSGWGGTKTQEFGKADGAWDEP